MIQIVIVDGKEELITSMLECSNIKTRVRTYLVNGIYLLNQRSQIIYECDGCHEKYQVAFRLREKYFKPKILCEKCTREQTNLERYGTKSSWASKETKEKIKKTNLERYGVEHVLQSPAVMNKFKKTCIERFGTDHPIKNEKIKNSRKQTNLDRYGVESNFASEEVKKKIKETNLRKYGVTAFTQSQEMKDKSKQTNLKKYGVDHAMKNSDIAAKAGKKLRATTIKKFVDRLFSGRLVNVIPLFDKSIYDGTLRLYDWRCAVCSNDFQDNLAMGKQPRCPICHPILAGTSKLEKEVAEWIMSLGIEIDSGTFQIIKPKQLDIYIPSYNLAIEFDGLYFHSELYGTPKNAHLRKTDSCKNKGISLIHIFEDEWLEKQEIVKSIICSKFGIYGETIGARKCEIKEIFSKEASDFYLNNHLQGSIGSKVNIGLFYENKLISCLSFSKPRYNKKYHWEITRFANKLNTKIVGSFARLLSYFKEHYEGSIITYSDKRWFDGTVYRNNGFVELNDSTPSYWYVKNQRRHSRIEFQKHKLRNKLKIFDPDLTEWQNMELNGYDRIWDCGNKVFECIR